MSQSYVAYKSGRWGAYRMIYDESSHLSGEARSKYIVERCRELGIKPIEKHWRIYLASRSGEEKTAGAAAAGSAAISWGWIAVGVLAVGAGVYVSHRLWKWALS